MPYLLKGATLITLDPPAIESAELRIKGGVVTERAARLDPQPGERVYDLGGKIVMPGLVCAHTHLYSALARGCLPRRARLGISKTFSN